MDSYTRRSCQLTRNCHKRQPHCIERPLRSQNGFQKRTNKNDNELHFAKIGLTFTFIWIPLMYMHYACPEIAVILPNHPFTTHLAFYNQNIFKGQTRVRVPKAFFNITRHWRRFVRIFFLTYSLLLIVTLSMAASFLCTNKTMTKKFADFIILFLWIFKYLHPFPLIGSAVFKFIGYKLTNTDSDDLDHGELDLTLEYIKFSLFMLFKALWFEQMLRLSLIKDILIIFKTTNTKTYWDIILRYCKCKAIERKFKNLRSGKGMWIQNIFKMNI